MKASFQRISSLYVHLLEYREYSGGDALRGNTRTHPEHDG